MSQTAIATAKCPVPHVFSDTNGIDSARLASSSSLSSHHVRKTHTHAEGDSALVTEAALGIVLDDGALPAGAHGLVERWNLPRANIGRLSFAFMSFIIAGMSDSAVGALIPYLGSYYNINYTVQSLIVLTSPIGYSIGAFTNARIQLAFGKRGIAVIAPLCHILSYAVIASHPPYPAIIVVNSISGFANGLTEACFCTWVGSVGPANTIQGLLTGCYSLGALFSPLIATSIVVKAEMPWFTFYYIMISISILELIGLSIFFWDKTAIVHKAEYTSNLESSGSTGIRAALKSKVTYLCALFFFAHMGVEVGIGGWIVTFMLRVRHASAYDSGISDSGFWAGMALGRMALGFMTERYGERLCLTIYLALCLGLQLLFWLVPEFVVSAIAVAFLGFFLGPVLPGAIIIMTKLLPKRIQVSAIGFAMAIGGIGGAVFPFIIGAVAASEGVQVLQPIVLALFAVLAVICLSFPRVKKRE